ncbi:DNA translocase FtsK [Comamonas sp.]|uniref:DNA translocase FtsK n=1 Tax=Comamonas sp. TaxID=34028 RepID=UPI003A949522
MSAPDNPLIDAARGREDQYIEAVALAKQKASVSFLQRKLVTSYHHAEDLLERMISEGHITGYSGRCIEKVQARQIIQLRARITELEAQQRHTPASRDCQRPECMSRGCFGHCMKVST